MVTAPPFLATDLENDDLHFLTAKVVKDGIKRNVLQIYDRPP